MILQMAKTFTIDTRINTIYITHIRNKDMCFEFISYENYTLINDYCNKTEIKTIKSRSINLNIQKAIIF